nr:MAG TPA: hypothetical protein [Caudoviricetes sp.]
MHLSKSRTTYVEIIPLTIPQIIVIAITSDVTSFISFHCKFLNGQILRDFYKINRILLS